MTTNATSKQKKSKRVKITPDQLREKIILALRTIYDPELPVNIYDLGLIYKVEVNEAAEVSIDMTLTTPSCPEAQSLPAQVEKIIQDLPEVKRLNFELVWDPPWDKDRLSEEIKMVLGIY